MSCRVVSCRVVSVSLSLSLSLSLASDSSETVEVIIVKRGMVTASDIKMHQVFIIIIIDTDLNHENNKCSIISKTVQAMPIMFAVKIVGLQVYIMFC